jgi:predicted TIM-barrel enzyme
VAKTVEFNCRPDGLCVSGLTAGAATDTSTLKAVAEAVSGTPVVVNTGVNVGNVREQLAIADAAIVGTAFKRDGRFENEADPSRVAALMSEVRALRAAL